MIRDVALIPGLNNTAMVWDDVVPLIGAAARCHALTSPALDSMDALARDWLDHLPPTFHLCGFSLGGYIALAMLAMAPERISGLALVCTSSNADTPQAVAAREKAIEAGRTGDYEAMIGAQAAFAFHPDSLKNEAVMAKRTAMVRQYGYPRFAAHARAAIGRLDRLDVLKSYTGPTLIVTTTHDKVVPTDVVRKMASEVPHARLEVLEGAGHLLPMESPAALAATLKGWLAA